MNGETGIVECAYVESDVVPECQWFATPIELGVNGIEKNLGESIDLTPRGGFTCVLLT